ncbi:3D domain-containing protein [Nitrosarchaeum koreense]|uniref:3D domain containing protein n=1 Tax=Nitrosarchaeum koreense MY1 TaxID=1001994 RepID=F9CWN3_9ARCH|nr:3D domain-containing protein [Nitrosarchaeum koreense]EGP93685.1 3D domain containing protein [Nitrosarchaeum koreense MY1]
MQVIFTSLLAALIIISIIPASFSQYALLQDESLQIQTENCTDGWYVTGYFLPLESDYSSNVAPVNIDGEWYGFSIDFLNEVKIQGWGKTSFGDFLGWDEQKYYLNSVPLDANDNELIIGTIAVDPKIIKMNSKITIPNSPPPWNEIIFSSNDVGPAIIGKHIDVYTGVGLDARKEAFRITSNDYSICIIDETLYLRQKNILKDSNFNMTKNQEWIQNIFLWYEQNRISEIEALNALKFLIEQQILKVK